jgi:hypothetical protein
MTMLEACRICRNASTARELARWPARLSALGGAGGRWRGSSGEGAAASGSAGWTAATGSSSEDVDLPSMATLKLLHGAGGVRPPA